MKLSDVALDAFVLGKYTYLFTSAFNWLEIHKVSYFYTQTDDEEHDFPSIVSLVSKKCRIINLKNQSIKLHSPV